eukprot:11185419-Lingulodinium_polyedra.AAC.1
MVTGAERAGIDVARGASACHGGRIIMCMQTFTPASTPYVEEACWVRRARRTPEQGSVGGVVARRVAEPKDLGR